VTKEQCRALQWAVSHSGFNSIHKVPLLELLAAGASEGQAERKLDKPAQVSHTSFGVGVSWSTVIGAAQRHYEYRNDKSVPRSYPDRYNIREIDALKLFPVDQSQRQFVDYTQYLTLQREYQATFAELTALRERIAGMEKDAERYRWINTHTTCDPREGFFSLPTVDAWDYKPCPELNEEFSSLDAAIDAAIAKESK
jgi:hypothetical protein